MEEYEKNHLDYVLATAAECTVLLKSDGHFPLTSAGKLAAFGSGVRHTVKGGTGSGEVNSRFTRTIEEGLEACGFEITSKKWSDSYDSMIAEAKRNYPKVLKKEAKEKHKNFLFYVMGNVMPEPYYEIPLEGDGDSAIYVLSRISGEGKDREIKEGDVCLTPVEVRDILELNRRYENFMLVLNVGGVIDLTPVMEVKNILVLSQLGVDCGRVLGDILLGNQVPSGKLATTWMAKEDTLPAGTFGQWNETEYKEGIYVGYRYFDSFGKKPLFPFGYGLSYTDFTITTTSVSNAGDTIRLEVEVTNTGKHKGKEVVQAYLSAPAGKLDKPYQDLVSFRKTGMLAPGESEKLTLEFTLSDFASFDESTSSYLLEKGEYLLRVGNNSRNTVIAACIELTDDICVGLVKKNFPKPSFSDITAAPRAQEELPSSVIRLKVDSSAFGSRHYSGNKKALPMSEQVSALTDEELCSLAIGFYQTKKGMSFIGNSSHLVAGAAGETTGALESKGIKSLVMSDGPAGLRIAKDYFVDANGQHDASGKGAIPDSLFEFAGPFIKFLVTRVFGGKKPPKDVEIKHHYATMIPISFAIAQSFNLELATSYGDIVGDEMTRFGINLWLAPSMNIHRTILCGRNFEYFSEDPLISGLFAAALVKGVQKHKGCGATIKHYAANNAETNRYGNNSNISERALREIYLKGFGIAVRNSRPKAVMTSYNLLNGIHTAENRTLIEDVLRDEFGFDGIVMTDWMAIDLSTKESTHRNTKVTEVVKAGGDLFMPGSASNYKELLEALKKGEVERSQLEENANRVLAMIRELA